MKVLVITGLFPNPARPVWGIHVFNNVRALSSRCDVRVVAPIPFVPGLGLRDSGTDRGQIPAEGDVGGIAVSYPRWPAIPLLLRPAHGRLMEAGIAATVARSIERHGADVVLAYFAYPYGAAAVSLARRHGLPVVVSCRGSDINRMTRPALQRRVIARSLRRASMVLAVSRALATRIEGLGVESARVRVIPNGVDVTRFRPSSREAARDVLGLPSGTFLAVCVSRMSEEKGIDVLLRAWQRFAAPDCRLAIVGDGPLRTRLEDLARSLNVAENVIFAGARPHEEIPGWFAAADVAVLPSRSEGYPNAVVEALASGRPVVATAVGGVPEIITGPRLGVMVPADDPGALAEGLKRARGVVWDEHVLVSAVASRGWTTVADDTCDALAAATRGDGSNPEEAGS